MQRGWAARNLTDDEAARVLAEWVGHARDAQYPSGQRPRTFLLIGGRGSGKTRTGAEWVNALVRGFAPFSSGRVHRRIALVGETLADVRDVMIEGPSGILALTAGGGRGERPAFEASRRRLIWPNGATAQIFSAEDPDSLRGPQFEAAWCDEVAKWRRDEETFDMLQFGLRLGTAPRQIVTTTPRPTRLVKRLLADAGTLVARMATDENAANLAAGFVDAMRQRYAGTRLGRQELDGELVEDRQDALWSRALIEAARTVRPAALTRIVVAVDPPAASTRSSDACGIVAAGQGADGIVYVLADASAAGLKPHQWAAAAVALFHGLEADCIVAEVNQGGDMVTAVIRTVDAAVPVRPVRARRGKWLRAEPVAALYQQGRVRHAGHFPALEDEMCDFGPDGLSAGRSPDRVDALVWAVTELTPARGAAPRVRDFK
ncbi:MAG: DNA-packaging protein [Rhizobiaceae bacterium]|nr:DNA-packaging protein [Rhizobiaceae bacterium]